MHRHSVVRLISVGVLIGALVGCRGDDDSNSNTPTGDSSTKQTDGGVVPTGDGAAVTGQETTIFEITKGTVGEGKAVVPAKLFAETTSVLLDERG